MALLGKIWATLKWLFAFIHPAFAWAGGWRRHSTTLLWIVHGIVVIAVLVGLALVNYKWLTAWVPVGGWLQNFGWLPLLGLGIYACIWLLVWIWLLWTGGKESSHFPDIDEAWDEAVRTLNRAAIDLRDVPLFLVLGRSDGNEEALFQSANLQLTVPRAPSRRDAPIHVYANRDGVYLTCPGASLLGHQAAVLAGEVAIGSETNGDGAVPFDPFITMTPKGRAEEVRTLLIQAKQEKRELTDEENEKIRHLVEEEKAESAQQTGRARSMLLKDGAERERLTARLRHFCRLVVRDRSPYCPINGILLVVPVAATDSDHDANQTGRLCEYDLKAVREVMQTCCPVFALVGDMELLPSNCFREFVDRFLEADRFRRVGQRFPLLPEIEHAALGPKIEEAAEWVCNSLVPNWVYKRFRLEKSGKESLDNALLGNRRLFHLMYQMWERQKRLGDILAKGVVPKDGSPPLFGGCYIGGTGRDRRDQAFVAGVFQRLIHDQSAVSWTDDALGEDASYKRGTVMQIVAIVAIIALTVVIAIVNWKR